MNYEPVKPRWTRAKLRDLLYLRDLASLGRITSRKQRRLDELESQWMTFKLGKDGLCPNCQPEDE